MIGKAVIGGSFKGAVKYVLQEGKESQILDSNLISGNKAKDISNQFENVAKTKPSITKNVLHTSISFAHQDNVNDKMMRDVAKDYLKEMGLTDKHQFLVVKHQDTEHKHFHIIANRIGIDGSVIDDKFCKNKTARICQKLEVKYDLTIAKEQGQKNGIKTDKRAFVNDIKSKIIKGIDNHFGDKKTSFEALCKDLEKQGIHTLKNESKTTGRIAGISFSCVGISVKGSQLGKDYSYNKLIDKIDTHNSKIESKSLNKEGLGFDSLSDSNTTLVESVKSGIKSVLKGFFTSSEEQKEEAKTPNMTPFKEELKPNELFLKAINEVDTKLLVKLKDEGYQPTSKDLEHVKNSKLDIVKSAVEVVFNIKLSEEEKKASMKQNIEPKPQQNKNKGMSM